MSKDIMIDIYCIVLIILSVILFLIGPRGSREVRELKEQAIEHGAAYYHPETAKFTWKERD